ncbi:coiled coil domain-containing protein [Oceanisphaera arctica]|uniref:Coiled coil domain-containing protein n=1 Tax=Oceanisphaera arctica TaxID=641510 RepID=A0A2P5TQP5_9GAMM|nr:coiled coil domain-containing protein [Oceanisphaera arctica]PPL18078.1 coiled coil domain-containing protein [Oceanisphaera arctica]GHA09652.1 hypothetical protein GCM10007082_08280 [Oceanisphaera arctica]
MNERELYQKKAQAKLDEWKAELDKLKAQASAASADKQLELNRHIDALDAKIEQSERKLDELSNSSEDSWESIKHGFESAWTTLKGSFKDAADKFK